MSTPVNVDVKLGINKFNVDEDNPHIIVKSQPDMQVMELLTKACPAGLYKKQERRLRALRLCRLPRVRHLPDPRAGQRAGEMGIPARNVRCGISLRLTIFLLVLPRLRAREFFCPADNLFWTYNEK